MMVDKNTPKDTTPDPAVPTGTPLQTIPATPAPVASIPVKSDSKPGAPNLNVTVLDHAGNPLSWDNDMRLRVTTSYLDSSRMPCARKQDCADDIQSQSDAVTFGRYIEPRRTAIIQAEIKYQDQDEWQAFQPLVTSLDCTQSATATLRAPAPVNIVRQQDKTQVLIEGRVCTSNAGHDETHKVEFEQVTARSTAKQTTDPDNKAAHASNPSTQATLMGNQAYLSLPPGEYELVVKTRENFARSFPRTPFYLTVGTQDVQHCIWFEPCHKTVTLMFADTCGNPVSGVELEVKGEGLVGPSNDQGMLSFTPSRIGSFHISSQSVHLKPDVLHVDERMAQAHVIEVLPKTHLLAGPARRDEIILDLIEILEEEQIAIVKLLTLDGKVLETKEAPCLTR